MNRMLNQEPEQAASLKSEVASVTPLQATGSIGVRLLSINVKGVSFVATESLPCGASDLLSLRFTLPGRSRLHFAMISLLSAASEEASGYRYEARFVRTDPQTVDHIITCSSAAPSSESRDRGGAQLH